MYIASKSSAQSSCSFASVRLEYTSTQSSVVLGVSSPPTSIDEPFVV